jgi:hypothetical protein
MEQQTLHKETHQFLRDKYYQKEKVIFNRMSVKQEKVTLLFPTELRQFYSFRHA